MKLIAGMFMGILVGSVLTYGLLPFPRVVWDGQDGYIFGGTFSCIGIGAKHGSTVYVGGEVKLDKPLKWCQGFLRYDFYSPN